MSESMTQAPGVYPFLLRFRGGHAGAVAESDGLVENDDAYAVWFATKEDRDAFEARHRAAGVEHIVWDRHDHGVEDWSGEPADVHRQTIAEVTLRCHGKDYTYRHNFGYAYLWHSVEFMYEEGNYSCDCNRSSFIQSYCGEAVAHRVCGDEIELVSLKPVEPLAPETKGEETR